MLNQSYKIGRIAGIPIRVHISLLLLLAYLSYKADFLTAVALIVGLFTSIVLHELGHSLVAIRKGCRVHEILLLPIGGAAQMESLPVRPVDELLTAAAGPAVSAVLFVVLYYGGGLIPVGSVEFAGVIVNFIQMIGLINLALLTFNVIPAFPMTEDGSFGRC